MALIRNGLPDDIQAHARRMVTLAARMTEVAAPLDSRVPRGSKPHPGPRIVESFEVGREGAQLRGTKWTVTARNTAPHARYTDEGTEAHLIVPRSARVLRFEVDGGVVFARRAQHPGTTGSHWFERVVGDAWDRTLAAANLSL